MPSPNVRRQRLRDFTVRIFDLASDGPVEDATVGTGIAVSVDGKVVTCAHVLRSRLRIDPRSPGGAQVGVYFPAARVGEEKRRRALVTPWPTEHDDDVVLLQLVDADGEPTAAPLAPEHVPHLGMADGSEGNPFLAYGYARRDYYTATHLKGDIGGPVEVHSALQVRLQAEPIELHSDGILPGVSGAAVLDVTRNLVVGVLTERWRPGADEPQDTRTGWAVDAYVLGLKPLGLRLDDYPYPLQPALQPSMDATGAQAAVHPRQPLALNNAPQPLPEWVGREEMLRDLSASWASPDCRVAGLIGFGGEGKSSLARCWLERLLGDSGQTQPNGVFWWGFYDHPSVDEFLEAALTYLGGGAIDLRQYPSANAKVHLIAAMLGAGRYLFVLDGLEVLQHQDGDAYGLVTSGDLRDLLSYFAAPSHSSFCLVTSRAPLLDLMEYATYAQHDVERLSTRDGRALLRRLGLQGEDEALDRLVADWDGHALTLSLLAACLVEHGSRATHINDVPAPAVGESRYERVHRVLRRYDEHMDVAEAAFLMVFSALRTPMHEGDFWRLHYRLWGEGGISYPIAALRDLDLTRFAERLARYRVLRHDTRARTYTAHPLIRRHYWGRLCACDEDAERAVHSCLAAYYLDRSGDMVDGSGELPEFPTLDDLRPLIEAVHHTCLAGSFDEAERIRWEYIDQGRRAVLADQLAAYDTELALLLEFFPSGDLRADPQVTGKLDRHWILNEVGLCLTNLGRLSEAAPLYERSGEVALHMEDNGSASIAHHNLSELYTHLGRLADATRAAEKALGEALTRMQNCRCRVAQARLHFLRGDLDQACAEFLAAQQLEADPYFGRGVRYLCAGRGVLHAECLRRAGRRAEAITMTEANLAVCRRQGWLDDQSRCHRMLGDLLADAGEHRGAGERYSEALRLARAVSVRQVLIEALLVRGRWIARRGDGPTACAELGEALGYASTSGYRIYEADIRVALAWAHLATGDSVGARAEATRARKTSAEMGYHWGQADADEVLHVLERKG